MNKNSKYAKLIDDTRGQICRAEIGVTGVFQLMIETLGQIERESADIAPNLNMVRADALRDAANTYCPVSGYIIRDERSRSDLMSWAQMVENEIDIEPPV